MVRPLVEPDALARINAAVTAAEARTSAEIVPVVARDSGRYDRAEDAVGFVIGLGVLALVWLVYPAPPEPGSWAGPPAALELVALLGAMIVGSSLGTALATRVPWLRRLAIPPAQMQEEVERAARAMFHDRRVHHTRERDAVMIYVSVFERVVWIIPDRAIEDRVDPERLSACCAVLTAKLGEGSPVEALEVGIAALGDELADALVVLG